MLNLKNKNVLGQICLISGYFLYSLNSWSVTTAPSIHSDDSSHSMSVSKAETFKSNRLEVIEKEIKVLDSKLKLAKLEFDQARTSSDLPKSQNKRELKIERAKKIYDKHSTIIFAKIFALQQEKKFLNNSQWSMDQYKVLLKTLKNRTQIIIDLTEARLNHSAAKAEKLEKGRAALDKTIHRFMLDQPFGPQKG